MVKTIRICYTILDVIEVPDDLTDEEITTIEYELKEYIC